MAPKKVQVQAMTKEPLATTLAANPANAPLAPHRMRHRLLVAGLLADLGFGAACLLSAWILWPASTFVLAGMARLVAWTWLAQALQTLLASGLAVYATGPIVRRDEGRDDPLTAISSEAVRDALRIPSWEAFTGIVVIALVVGAEVLQLLAITRIHGQVRFELYILVLGWACISAYTRETLWRSALQPWLVRVQPATADVPLMGSLARSATVHAALLFAGISLLGAVFLSVEFQASWFAMLRSAGVMQAPLPWLPVAWGTAALVVGSFIVVSGIRQIIELLAKEARALEARLRELTDLDADPALAEASTEYGERLTTREAMTVAAAVQRLARRYNQLALEEKTARIAIEEAQRIKTRFVAYMSHDLRSPLNSICGFTDLLQSGAEGPLSEAQRESLELIRQSGKTLLVLVDDILSWAKVDAGRLRLRPRWISLPELLEMAKSKAAERQPHATLPEVVTELHQEVTAFQVDHQHFAQAVAIVLHHLQQLAGEQAPLRLQAWVATTLRAPERPSFELVIPQLHDASERTPVLRRAPQQTRRGHLRMDLMEEGGQARSEHRRRVWEAYQELRQPTGKRIGGLALGLALARALINAHDGELWYAWHSNKGSVFSLSVPLVEERGGTATTRYPDWVRRRAAARANAPDPEQARRFEERDLDASREHSVAPPY